MGMGLGKTLVLISKLLSFNVLALYAVGICYTNINNKK